MSEDRIRALIADGDVERALEALRELAASINRGLENDTTLLLSQYRSFRRQNDLGVMSSSALSVERTRITQAALRLTGELCADSTGGEKRATSRHDSPDRAAPDARGRAEPINEPPPVAVPVASVAKAAPLRVFVSYAHDGSSPSGARSSWLDELLVQLKPLVREKIVVVWSDRQIDDGTRFDRVIRGEVERADAAILLVNARFLASDYIYQNELPILLERHRLGEISLYVLVLEHCGLAETRFKYPDSEAGPYQLCLGQLQTAHPPDLPLDGMPSLSRQQVLAGLASKLRARALAGGTRLG